MEDLCEVRHQRCRRDTQMTYVRSDIRDVGEMFKDLREASAAYSFMDYSSPHARSLPPGFAALSKLIRVLSFEWVGEKVTSFIVYIQLSKAQSSLSIYLSPTSCWKSCLWLFPLNNSLSLHILTETRKYLAHIHFYSPLFRFRHLCSRYKINFLLLLCIWIAYDG